MGMIQANIMTFFQLPKSFLIGPANNIERDACDIELS
jgi:hypothetical protein